MNKIFVFLFFVLIIFGLKSSSIPVQEVQYKCMVQIKNYKGEGAYVIVSLINPKGDYEKTLYVIGDDPEWYYELSSWWKFYGKKRTKIDGISGATLAGGERAMCILNLDKDKINRGYRLRFETAVENQNYHEKDIEIRLNKSNLAKKFDGNGYVMYVRFIEVQ